MKLSVVGVGHVGLVTAACLARWGHDVIGLDDDADKIAVLKGGGVPFHEPGLPELLEEVTEAGRLRFTSDIAEAVAEAEVVFVCVGTPPLPGGGPNLSFVERVGRDVAEHAQNDLVLVEKSTVPATTGERLTQVIRREHDRLGKGVHIDVASNPEFLREGNAVEDTLHPDRIVYGTASERARDALRGVYRHVVDTEGIPVVETTVPTAELIKHASNAFLATKISFINAVARVCDIVGADVDVVADGMGLDERIGRHFLYAGLGYGGSCLVAEESVLVRRDGRSTLTSIADFLAWTAYTGLEGWEVLAWDPAAGGPRYLPVVAATARRYSGDLVEVRTKMGRRLRTTADHPFVVGDGAGGAPAVRLAGELSEDDWLPLSVGLPSTVEEQLVAGPLAAVGAGAVSAGDVIMRMDPAETAEVTGHAERIPAPRRYDVLRRGTIRLDEYRSLGLDYSGGSLGTARNGTYVPGEIELDEDFWRVVGLFLAEGYVSEDGPRMRTFWTFHPTDEQHFVDFLHDYWERLGVKTSVHGRETSMTISISSRLLGSWFRDVLRLGHNAYTKRIPDEIWDAPVEHKRSLLRGLWDGDGSWSLVNGGPSAILEYGTVSRELADGMLRLLGDLGLVAALRVGRTAKSTVDTYWLRISGADQIERSLWLVSDAEADEIRASLAQQTKRIAPTGYRSFDDGTSWVRVTSAEREHFEGLVYSLEVPHAHTIVSTGGLVTHNCFPKDVDAFLHLSRQVGYDFQLLEEVRKINEGQRDLVLNKLRDELWHLSEKTITILGAAFKPGTDDLREAPAIHLARMLLEEGATVRIYDPIAIPQVKAELDGVETFDDPLEACRGAHAAVVATEWDEVRALTAEDLREALGYPIVIDGRNALDGDAMRAAGLHYHAVGKPGGAPGSA